ncbi:MULTISPECIES: hypothetical protein [unclassified Natrinema]|uniref:hypothetical protein n=1 Tax=unclassified Natrinema TaxID=2622230 RepID=UPI0006777086|nr:MULTISPECIES: hypothetical protein [unclassified Natrinema]
MVFTELASSTFTIGFFTIYFFTLFFAFYWVYSDAKKQGHESKKALLWGIVVGLFLPIGLLYLYLRDSNKSTSLPISRTEQLIKVVVLAGVTAVFIGGIIAPPDPLTQVRYTVLAFPVCMVIGYLIIQRKKILSTG